MDMRHNCAPVKRGGAVKKLIKDGVRKGFVDTIASYIKDHVRVAISIATGVAGSLVLGASWRLLAASYPIRGWAIIVIAMVPAGIVGGIWWLSKWRASRRKPAKPPGFTPQPIHVEIIKQLRSMDTYELWASHVAHHLKIPESDAEHYLAQLVKVGWVNAEKKIDYAGRGLVLHYRLKGPGQQYAMDQGFPVRQRGE